MYDTSVEGLLGRDGPIAGRKEQYEYREGQITMANMVERALAEDQVCIIEAGTGIGKSFAYLVPILSWCMDHQEKRAVIATSTIHLQQQLYEKDIPFLQDVLHMPVRTTVLKGRNNYICKRRLYQAYEQRALFGEHDSETLGMLMLWVNQTTSGDHADISSPVSPQVWGRVCSDRNSCMGYRCQYRNSCFVMQARKQAAESQIIIVNHHLLFADMMLRQDEEDADHTILLPSFTRLVIDEAHNIEKNATSYFTETYDAKRMLSMIYTLSHTRKGKIGGLLEDLRSFSDDPMAFNEIYTQLTDLKVAIDVCDTAIDTFIGAKRGSHFIERSRFLANKKIVDACSTLSAQLSSFLTVLIACLDSCEEVPEIEIPLYEAGSVKYRIESIQRLLGHYLTFDLSETHVYWIDSWMSNAQIPHLTLKLTPIEFADMFREGLFNMYKTVICTSATLTVQNRFDFWEKKVGIGEGLVRDCVRKSIGSPFNYRDRVLLCLPKDAPEPTAYHEYMEYSAKLISRLISTTEGGALILFTSYAMLHEMHQMIAAEVEKMGINVLKQGNLDRYKLMREFVEDEHSVLFATQSFWEGVDAPGNTLRLLIVCRLPFSVPTEPIFYAKKLMAEQQGRNSFFELALPDAIIRLKQGFGRLMRTSEDRGVVCLLDSRVINKRYGKVVIASLPQTQIYVNNTERIIERVEDFLYSS